MPLELLLHFQSLCLFSHGLLVHCTKAWTTDYCQFQRSWYPVKECWIRIRDFKCLPCNNELNTKKSWAFCCTTEGMTEPTITTPPLLQRAQDLGTEQGLERRQRQMERMSPQGAEHIEVPILQKSFLSFCRVTFPPFFPFKNLHFTSSSPPIPLLLPHSPSSFPFPL